MSGLTLKKSFTEKQHHDVYPSIDPRKTLAGSMKGKSLLVTGAGRGIGKEMAIAFAHAGVRAVALVARTTHEIEAVAKELREINADIIAVSHTADLTDAKSVDKCIKESFEKLGSIDILIANAGYLEHAVPLADSDPDEWWSTYEINIKGTYLTVRSFLRARDDCNATVILVTSAGSYNLTRGISGYQTSKTSVNRMAEFLDFEYGKEGLRAFAMHPGGVQTTLARNMPKGTEHLLQDKPQMAAGFAVYLADPKADYLRGRYVSSSWDVDEMETKKDAITSSDMLKTRVVIV